MLLSGGGMAGGARSSLRPVNDENANAIIATSVKKSKLGGGMDEKKKARSSKQQGVRLALAPADINAGGGGGGGSKTPRPTSHAKRRAFGDISNRKPGRGGGGGFGGNVVKSKGTSKSVSFQTPGRRDGVSKSTRKVPGSGQRINTPFGAAGRAATKKRQALTPHRKAATTTTHNASKPKQVMFAGDDVEDVELPAGRLWDSDDFFGDDDGLNNANESIEELRGAQDDVKAVMSNRREAAMRRAREKPFLSEDADAELSRGMGKLGIEDDYDAVVESMDDLLDGLDNDYDDDPLLHPCDADGYRRPEYDEFAI